jgi:hypothetical protein
MVRGTVVVNDIHVSNATMGFKSPTPLLWWLPRGGSRCPPLSLLPQLSSVQCGNGSDNNKGGPHAPFLDLSSHVFVIVVTVDDDNNNHALSNPTTLRWTMPSQRALCPRI